MSVSVLVVDDSITVRTLMSRILQSDDQIKVCGTAPDGETALSIAQSRKPDVITLDLNMPGLNGQEVTRKIMEVSQIPIIIVTTDKKSTSNPFSLLEAGAVAVLQTPSAPGHPQHEESVRTLIDTIKALKGKRIPYIDKHPHAARHQEEDTKHSRDPSMHYIAIGASTGGPVILKKIIDALPASFPIPVLITQHIAKGFTDNLCKWLSGNSKLKVVVATEGATIEAGKVYLAPDDSHMGVTPKNTITLSSSGREYGMRPAIAYMFRSLDRTGKKCVAIVLSGMGKDGALEMAALRERGCFTIAQDRASSLIYGIPGEAVACGGVEEVWTPEQIIDHLRTMVAPRRG